MNDWKNVVSFLLLLHMTMYNSAIVNADSGAEDATQSAATKNRINSIKKLRKRGFLKRKEVSIASILFPGVAPEEYFDSDQIPM
jgi:hypothetical protein